MRDAAVTLNCGVCGVACGTLFSLDSGVRACGFRTYRYDAQPRGLPTTNSRGPEARMQQHQSGGLSVDGYMKLSEGGMRTGRWSDYRNRRGRR